MEALEDYIGHLDKELFGFFVYQFDLQPAFLEKIGELKRWMAKMPAVPQEALEESNLLELLCRTQDATRWHWHAPKRVDARRVSASGSSQIMVETTSCCCFCYCIEATCCGDGKRTADVSLSRRVA